jgi:hypothetical protein
MPDAQGEVGSPVNVESLPGRRAGLGGGVAAGSADGGTAGLDLGELPHERDTYSHVLPAG